MEKKTLADSKFWKFVNLAGNAIGLNLIFLVCCIPIVTIGPALCGLYSGVRYLIRGDGWWSGFWKGFSTRWLRTAIVGLLIAVFQYYVLMQLNDMLIMYFQNTASIYYVVLYGILALIPALLTASLWPLNVYIPYSSSEWLNTSVSLVYKAPIPVFLAGVLFLAPIALAILTHWFYYALIVVLAVYFALSAFIATLFYKDALLDLLQTYRAEHPEIEDNQE